MGAVSHLCRRGYHRHQHQTAGSLSADDSGRPGREISHHSHQGSQPFFPKSVGHHRLYQAAQGPGGLGSLSHRRHQHHGPGRRATAVHYGLHCPGGEPKDLSPGEMGTDPADGAGGGIRAVHAGVRCERWGTLHQPRGSPSGAAYFPPVWSGKAGYHTNRPDAGAGGRAHLFREPPLEQQLPGETLKKRKVCGRPGTKKDLYSRLSQPCKTAKPRRRAAGYSERPSPSHHLPGAVEYRTTGVSTAQQAHLTKPIGALCPVRQDQMWGMRRHLRSPAAQAPGRKCHPPVELRLIRPWRV